MSQVATILRQPQTGKPADDAEVTTIETLSDLVNLINEQAQRPNSQQSPSPGDKQSDEEMQFLMQMMRNSANAKAMAAKPATGLNGAGGSTDRAGRAPRRQCGPPGEAQGRATFARREARWKNHRRNFAKALENYYHGIDQSH